MGSISYPVKAMGSKAQVSYSLRHRDSSWKSSCSAYQPWSQEYNRKTVLLVLFFLSHSQKDQVRLAWHVMEWVGKPFCLKRRKCHPQFPITSIEKAEL